MMKILKKSTTIQNFPQTKNSELFGHKRRKPIRQLKENNPNWVVLSPIVDIK